MNFYKLNLLNHTNYFTEKTTEKNKKEAINDCRSYCNWWI